MSVKRFVVSGGDVGAKLQSFLKQQLGAEWSTRKVKGLIDRNRCRVNGKLERYGCTTLRQGDEVEFGIDSPRARIRVVWEDEHLLGIAKPPGLNHEQVCKVVEGIAVHRLDRDTSGLLLFAKTSEVAEAMEKLFREREVSKRYMALVDGVMEGRGTQCGKIKGRSAETYWQVVRAGEEASLVRCAPKTGRTHQLRIHLSRLGYPVLGDGTYCRRFKCSEPVPRHMLHAERLIFAHPVTGEKVVLEEAVPSDFKRLMERVL